MGDRKSHCPQGHPRTPENLRPGRTDCAVCHRDQQRARARAAGAQPRTTAGASWSCGHGPEKQMRYVKGKPKDCKICHRERERGRPYNAERVREYARKNRARLNKYRKAWTAANRPGTPGRRQHTGSVREYVEIISTDPCAYCGAASTEIDHIRAVTRGGGGEWDNLAPTCRSCNAKKMTRDVLQFMLRRLPLGAS